MVKVSLLALAAVLSATQALADACPTLSVADAHVLTRAQLEARVCAYVKTSNDMIDKGGLDVATACLSRALDVEALYQERFSKKTKCWPPETGTKK